MVLLLVERVIVKEKFIHQEWKKLSLIGFYDGGEKKN